MNYKKWTSEDDCYILNNYKTKTVGEMAQDLERGERVLRLRANKLGIDFRNKWTQDEIAFLRENYGVMPLSDISKYLNRTEKTIRQTAFSNNVKSPYEWTEEDVRYLIENYESNTYKELCDRLGRTECAIATKANKLGLKKSKYSFNHNYFECIDTAEKAYWLGFIYADGYVRIDHERHGYQLVIKLQASDHMHLKKINKALEGNVDVKFSERICNLNNKKYSTCEIVFNSKKLVADLSNLGAVQAKTFVIEYPKIPCQFDKDFIRGYFDGDGCLTTNGDKPYLRANFTCGSIIFLEQLRNKLFSYNIKSYFDIQQNHAPRLWIGGTLNVDNFLNFMYDDANIFLDRKYYKKTKLYQKFNIEQCLLRQLEKAGSLKLSEKENGNPETEIRVEGRA